MENARGADQSAREFDAIVIGSGVAGIYQLYRLKKLAMRVLLIEAAEDVGGVWWWNRYPGARLDSESYSYAYSFSEELLGEWTWTEHFASQPELRSYFSFVVDKFGLREHILFKNLVTAAHYREGEDRWSVTTDQGLTFEAKYVIAAVGPLTSPTIPAFPGKDTFEGEAYHTSRWPHEAVDFTGKRVAVIGTGATGIQVIQEAAKVAAHLTVFQRTPNYCAPLNNAKIDEDEMAEIRQRYPDIIARCRSTNSWFIHGADRRSAFDLSPEERERFLEGLYADRGIGIWKANFHDIGTDPEANHVVSEFMRRKIRERVNDPEVAEKLVPKSYGFGLRRVPLETRYYEVYNQANVRLVDVNETPIERVTAKAIFTSDSTIEVDVIVYATGFDAVTGSFDRIDIRGQGGLKLKDKWKDGPKTFLGVHSSGFPNFFMPGGPLSSVGNFTPALEYSVNWIMDLLEHMQEQHTDVVDVWKEAEDGWTDRVREGQKQLLMGNVRSWFTGMNTNVEGKDSPRVVLVVGSAEDYRNHCERVKQGDYKEFCFSQSGSRSRDRVLDGNASAAA